jgi:hypothetical protein
VAASMTGVLKTLSCPASRRLTPEFTPAIFPA